ncbi:MAG: NADH-quinone oxidoreductase subunit NuoG [Sphingomonadales bacterium]
MAKVTIDGNRLDVADGTLILEAAGDQGISIPTFCYQARLTPLASCRMCLVEIEDQPKLQPACATPVTDGMVVRTDTELVAQTRESMLEMLLANHPLDCPICDKAGECELQDTVFAYGAGVSRFSDQKRVFRTKDILLNPVIVFNANRCIQCQRCVRICEEVVGAVALGTIERGMDSEITGFENSLKGCDHCGNCIEVCPVGALMSNPYRYKARPWDLTETDTTCPYCGTGCQLTVGLRDGHLARVRSKYETGVNGETLCVKGRFGFDFIDGENRIRRPMVRRDGTLVPVSWDEAVGYFAKRVEEIKSNGSGRIGGLASAGLTNETLYLFQKLMRMVFATNNIDSSSRLFAPSHALAEIFGGLYARRPLDEVLEADCILVVGSNVTDDNPVTDYLVRGAVRNKSNKLFMVSARPSRLDSDATAHLRLAPGGEAALLATLANGRLEDAPKAWQEFLQKAIAAISAARSVTVLVGVDLLRSAEAERALQWLGKFGRMLEAQGKHMAVQFLFDRSNQMGAWEMGALPAMLPGWRPVEDGPERRLFETAWGSPLPSAPGVDIHRMLAQSAAGDMDMLYVLGSDPVLSYPDSDLAESALSKLDLLVVQDAYLSETASLADIVLPAPAFTEEAGTFTSNQGMVQRVRQLRRPGFEARSNGEIFGLIASALGRDPGVTAPGEVLNEIARLAPTCRDLNLEAIGEQGAFTNSTGTAARTIEPVNPPIPPEPGGLMLVTGDCRFHSGYLSRHSATLKTLEMEPYVEMSPADCVRLQLAGQERVTVRSHRGELQARIKINKRFPDGIVFVPENFAEIHLNRLLKQGDYPCVVEIVSVEKSTRGAQPHAQPCLA